MEDAAIVKLYWDRDQQAIAASDEKYGPLCRTLSFRIVNSREDAEECVNDTWHRAWDTMPPQRPESLRAYLCRIVRNLSIDRWRSRRAQRRGGCGEELALELEECLPAASAPSAEEQWELEQVAAAVERWLAGQSARDRALFLRRYFAGWPVGELAGQLGLGPNAAAQRLRRLRQSLARALEEEGAVL